ncbi:MAG: hypothetical protein R6W76_08510 [Caldilinea sp.]
MTVTKNDFTPDNVAVATAEAAKEGDFMGIGGVRVNEAEKAALQQLAEILGVQG